MTTTDEISALDHTYLLNEDEWTEAAQSPNSPEVSREIELGAEQGRTAAMLGTILVAAWLTIIACGWILWRIL